MTDSPKNIAILFWFYKNPEIVVNRLKGIRWLNSDVRIFGLYGGNHEQISEYAPAIELLDDVWLHPEVSADWAWLNGDLMFARWHIERGNQLNWDNIFIYQWDLITTVPINNFNITENQIILTGVRSFEEIANFWVWVQRWSIYYPKFQAFCHHPLIKDRPLWASIFIFATLSRRFLNDYFDIAKDIPGFIEYRLPTVAQILGYGFAPAKVFPDWGDRGDPFLNGQQREVTPAQVEYRLSANPQAAMFHPVYDFIDWDKILKLKSEGFEKLKSLSVPNLSAGSAPKKTIGILQVPPARPDIASGGSQVVALTLARQLARENFPVTLFSGTTDGVETEIESEGLIFRSSFKINRSILKKGVPSMQFFDQDRQLLERCDVVFMFDRIYPVPVNTQKILVLGVIAYSFAEETVLSDQWQQMIVPSNSMLKWVSQLLTVNGQADRIDQIFVVPNPVEFARLGLTGENPSRKKVNSTPLKLLFPHRSDEGKGIRRSLQLLSELVPICETTLTVIIDQSPTSDAKFYDSLIETAEVLGILDNIEFSPWVPVNKMGEIFVSADLTLCLGDIDEGFGLICLESILCGTPVLAQKGRGHAQILPPDHGCFTTAADQKESAEFVCRLMENPQTQADINRGREFILKEFSAEKFLLGYKNVMKFD